jgi:hypothetical protein
MVVILIPSGILYMISEWLNFSLGWGCLPHAQPPAILEDQCFLSDKFDIAREIFWCVSESVVSRWQVFPWYVLRCVIAVCRVELICVILSAPGGSREGGGRVSYESIEILWCWHPWAAPTHLSVPCCQHPSPPRVSVPQVIPVRSEWTVHSVH